MNNNVVRLIKSLPLNRELKNTLIEEFGETTQHVDEIKEELLEEITVAIESIIYEA